MRHSTTLFHNPPTDTAGAPAAPPMVPAPPPQPPQAPGPKVIPIAETGSLGDFLGQKGFSFEQQEQQPTSASQPATPTAPQSFAVQSQQPPPTAPPNTAPAVSEAERIARLMTESQDASLRAEGHRRLAEMFAPAKSAPAQPPAPQGPSPEEVEKEVRQKIEDALIDARREYLTDENGNYLIDPETKQPKREGMKEARARLNKDRNFRDLVEIKQEQELARHRAAESEKATAAQQQARLESFVESEAADAFRKTLSALIPGAFVEANGKPTLSPEFRDEQDLFETMIGLERQKFTANSIREALPGYANDYEREFVVLKFCIEKASQKFTDHFKRLLKSAPIAQPQTPAQPQQQQRQQQTAPHQQQQTPQKPASVMPVPIGPGHSSAAPFAPQVPGHSQQRSVNQIPLGEMERADQLINERFMASLNGTQ